MRTKMVYDKTDTCYMVLPDYGKQRLMTYAESLEELSNSYLSVEEEELSDRQDRGEKIFLQKVRENRSVISGQLATISRMLKGLANEAYCITSSMEKHKRQIYKILTENGLDVQNLYTVSNQNGYLEIGMTLRARYSEDLFESANVAEFLSKLLHNHMDVAPSVPPYIGDEYVKVVFREEVRFLITTGVARATKEGEVHSGDNFTMTELSDGTFLAAISDGMGSGEQANRDSAMVIELLEQFLEAGFTKEAAAGMINDLLMVRAAEPRTATLDMMKCNLYSGECRFLKIGAAPSFIKRGRDVRMFMERSLPLGLFAKSSEKRDGDLPGSFLRAGDIVIMLSDGITDSVVDASAIQRFLERYEFVSCKDLANQILGMTIMALDGYIQDDMTVLVMQLQER